MYFWLQISFYFPGPNDRANFAAVSPSTAGSVCSLAGKELTSTTLTSPGSGIVGIPRRGCERYNKKRAGTIEDWAIRSENVIMKEKIGNGSFGTVYKADYFGLIIFGIFDYFFLHFRYCCSKEIKYYQSWPWIVIGVQKWGTFHILFFTR